MTEYRYFKPKSVAWWSGVAMIAMGAAIAASAALDLTRLGVFLSEVSGDQSAYSLIFTGLGLVGIRGAV